MTRTYRPGPIGALMDEYERVTDELLGIVEPFSDETYDRIRDTETEDEDCRSFRTILHHVARAGYGYADLIRGVFEIPSERPDVSEMTREENLHQIRAMLDYTAATLDGRWEMPYEEISAVRIQARWGPMYDLEQLLEHAVLHVMRHRRQIERFLLKEAAAG